MNKRGKNRYFSKYNFFPKNRRGSHVEVIISFIIFVTFIFFLFSVIEPSMNIQKDKKNIFDNIEIGITNKISSDMTVITANITSGGGNCIGLINLMSNLEIGNNIIVKDSSGKTVSSSINGNSLQINRANVNYTFFKIYYSEEFDELETNSRCSEINYGLGLTKKNKYIFEKNFRELMSEKYSLIKAELKIGEGLDFGYGLILSNGSVFENNEGKFSTNVYVRETPIEYVDLDGNILAGYIKTKIW